MSTVKGAVPKYPHRRTWSTVRAHAPRGHDIPLPSYTSRHLHPPTHRKEATTAAAHISARPCKPELSRHDTPRRVKAMYIDKLI